MNLTDRDDGKTIINIKYIRLVTIREGKRSCIWILEKEIEEPRTYPQPYLAPGIQCYLWRILFLFWCGY